jgi:hypothetical protein
MTQAFSLIGICGNEPRALPWAGMKQAFGVALGASITSEALHLSHK